MIFGALAAALLMTGCGQRQPPPPPAPPRFVAQPGELLHFVPVAEKLVALSFDDGPNDPCTRQLLAICAKENVHVTFMLIGLNAAKHPDIVQEIVAGGHAIGNHSLSHPRFDRSTPAVIREEITQADAIFEKLTGQKPLLMRPPFGLYGQDYFEICRDTGHVIGGWSAAASDWNPHTPEEIAGALLDQLAPGAIFLLHDGKETNDGPHRVASVQAVARLIPQVKARGYRFVTIPELLAAAVAPPAAYANGVQLLGVQWPERVASSKEVAVRMHWQLPAALVRSSAHVWLTLRGAGGPFTFDCGLPHGGDVWKETETLKVPPPAFQPGSYTMDIALTPGDRNRNHLPCAGAWAPGHKAAAVPQPLVVTPNLTVEASP
jgi:peptidoglycan/xylan/chitin deacetylase (PgdA/CDA1 family)